MSHHSLHPLAYLVQGGARDVLSVQFVEGVVITALRLCEDFTLGEPLSSLSTTSLPLDQTGPPASALGVNFLIFIITAIL